MNLDGSTIAVIGLGYVGLPLAMEFARTRTVIGFDIRRERIDELRGGQRRNAGSRRRATWRRAAMIDFTDDAERVDGNAASSSSPCRRRSTSANRPDLRR